MADADSSTTDTTLASTSTATTVSSHSAPTVDHPSDRDAKIARRTSLGLIDAARIRLSMDLHSLLRSNSKSQRIRTVLSTQAEVSEGDAGYPNYAKVASHIVDLEVRSMDATAEERTGRGFGARIVNFLNRSRSRSRSKRRRSRSLDAYPVDPMPHTLHTASLRVHARHSSLEHDHAADVAGPSRPSTRLPSRPLSNTTTATNTTVKPRPKKVTDQRAGPVPAAPSATAELVAQVVPIEATKSSSSRKGKGINIFGIFLPSPRKGSYSESSRGRSRPTTPSPSGPTSPEPLWQGRDDRGWTEKSGSQRSQRSTRKGLPMHVEESAVPCLPSRHTPDGGRSSALPGLVAPQPRRVPVHVINSASGNRDQFVDDPDAELRSVEGRCSPLCGLGTSSRGSNTSRETTKEKERMRGARERSGERERDRKEKDREREKERITHPRRVGSPMPRVQSTSAVAVSAVPMEKSNSGRSANSKRSGSKDHHGHPRTGAEPLVARANRIKHGSFDFERPMSAGTGPGGGISIRTALRSMGIGEPEQHPMQRSHSARAVPMRRPNDESLEDDIASASHPSKQRSLDKGKKPATDVRFANPPSRHPVDNSTPSSAYSHTQQGSHSHSRGNAATQASHSHHGSRRDPIPPSPMSSTSGESSGHRDGSWGRSGGKRAGRGSHGMFKFEPAVPPIPGSPADNERISAPRSLSRPTSPSPLSSLEGPTSKSKQARLAGKGRSLDLGLGLTWAPSKVREEAVLRVGPPRSGLSLTTSAATSARSRWRGADEEGRLTAGAASDVAEAFKEVLGDSAYGTFKNYVHRFDANAIPLDGPYGLLVHVERLLDNAPGLDHRRKRILLERFLRVVQHSETQTY
ncbi:hypothetical protein K466DRAFT_564462 [Polyporus arcularius HHB13444]|uniref:Uncharacterized protein n=1 Tax=Polyporus arcularius HHB13444 TaxID=1314778 RepID=A0A5C3PI03_9APHY|nr:hypothetical protein K466DRAFT_564462 [Polyporus arcularius HHB13444]